MIARRQFSQIFLSTLAVLSLPKAVLALPSVSDIPLTHASHHFMPTIEDDFGDGTQFKIIGVGGAGCNTVNHISDHRVPSVEYICVNTDALALGHCRAHKVIQLGTDGQGTGGRQDVAHEAASQAEDEIRAAIEGTHMLFIIAGMGGGTGTGAAPVIARIAKNMGILTVGVVTMPFDFEGEHRRRNAEAGLSKLEAHVDSLIVLSNEKLLQKMPNDVTQEDAFGYVDDLIQCAVCGVAEIMNVQGQVGVDFEDVRFVMSKPGTAKLANAIASGPDRAQFAAEYALTSFSQEGIDLSEANGVLVLISGAKGSLILPDIRLAIKTIRKYTSPDSTLIYGTTYDESLKEKIKVTLVATGFNFGTGTTNV